MGNYVGKHLAVEDAESLYDQMYEDLFGTKNRMRKFERTHHADNSKKDKTNKERKAEKFRRISKMYGFCFEDGKDFCWACGPMGRKKSTELDADIVINAKIAEREKSAYVDLLGDPEHYVGKTTLTKRRDRIWRDMQKIANDFCNRNGYQWGEDYAYDPENHFFHVDYPDKFYNLRSDMLVIESIMHDQYIKKVAKGTVEKSNPADIVEYIESHMEWAIAEYGKEEVRNILYRFRELARMEMI